MHSEMEAALYMATYYLEEAIAIGMTAENDKLDAITVKIDKELRAIEALRRKLEGR